LLNALEISPIVNELLPVPGRAGVPVPDGNEVWYPDSNEENEEVPRVGLFGRVMPDEL